MPDRTREERIADALGEWRRRRERDPALDSAAFLADHADLAEALAEHLAAERLLGLFGSPPAAAAPPRVLGDFRIVREIGRGGMGIVYEAEQVSMRRVVALKVLHPAVTLHPQAIERFRREAQAAGRLHHTNIVPVFAMGEADGCWWYAMELVKGRTLAEICADLRRLGAGPARDTPATSPSALGSSSGGREFYLRVARAFAGVAEALHVAHLANVVHRDVKPSNLILDDDGTLKLTDFGLARMEGELPTVTLTGAVLGTPAYMSPEQVRGAGGVDARTDVYSLGASLYELLTLRPPFRGATDEVLAKIARGSPPSPRAFERRIPRDLETIVMKALERDPERRYRTAADLARDLTHFAEGLGIQARRASLPLRAWRAFKRHRRAVLTAAAVLLAGGVTAAALLSASRSDEARARIAYDQAVQGAAVRLVEQAWFGDGLLQRLNGETRRDLHPVLAAASAERPQDPAPAVLAALLPEIPYEQRLAELDAAHARGLPEAPWRWGRAYLLLRQGAREEGLREVTSAVPLAIDEPWTGLLAGYVRMLQGQRPEALVLFDLVLEELVAATGHPVRPLAHYARAFTREQQGDLNRALEDYAAFGTSAEFSWPHVTMRMATIWWRLGERERAENAFRSALATVRQAGRKDAIGHLQVVMALRGYGLPWAWLDEATQAMLEDHPESAQAWSQRAECLWTTTEEPDMAEVVRLQAKACELADTDAQRRQHLLTLSLMKLVCDRHQEAYDLAERALALAPDSSEASVVKARALSGLGRHEEAVALARAALARDPGPPTLHHAGPILLAAGADDEAIRVARRAVVADPSCVNCRRTLLQALRKAQRWAELKVAAREMIALTPDNPGPWSCLSHACGALEDWQGYLEASQALTRIQPQDPDWWSNLADALARLGKPAEALPKIRHAMSLATPDAKNHRIAADCLWNLNRRDEAVAELKAAIDAGRADDLLFDEAVHMLREAGRLDEAVELAREGLRRFPDALSIERELLGTLLALGRAEECLPLARAILERDPSEGTSWKNVAVLQRQLGHRDDALATVRKGLERTNSPTVRELLARMLADAGEVEQAREVRRPLVEGEPEAPGLVEPYARAVCEAGTPQDASRLLDLVRARWGAQEATQWAMQMVLLLDGLGDARPDAKALAEHVAHHAVAWPDVHGDQGVYLRIVAGQREQAALAIARLPVPTTADEAYMRAFLHAGLQRRAEMLEYLHMALRMGWRSPRAGGENEFAPYQDDAQVQEALQKLR